MHIKIVIILWKRHMLDFFKLRFWMSKDEWFEKSVKPHQSISYQQNIELVLLFASAAQMLHCLKSVTKYRQSIE